MARIPDPPSPVWPTGLQTPTLLLVLSPNRPLLAWILSGFLSLQCVWAGLQTHYVRSVKYFTYPQLSHTSCLRMIHVRDMFRRDGDVSYTT